MDEERGFLNAIAADPGDDLVRLVFADWLEERGDFRSDYVRMLVDCTGRLAEDDPDDLRRRQFDGLADRIDLGWREAVGIRFDAVLESVVPGRMISAINLIREITPGLGLKEAKDFVCNVPGLLKSRLLLEDAMRLRSSLQRGYPPPSRYTQEFPFPEYFCVVSIRRSPTPG